MRRLRSEESHGGEMLPIYKIKGKLYFLDKRLGEYRNIRNPDDRIDFNSFPKLQKPTAKDAAKIWPGECWG